MKKIEWSPSLNLGIPKIDDQHKRLVQLANTMISASQSDGSDEMTAMICEELREYTQYHFRDEERVMEEAGYPDLAPHREEHKKLTERVQALHEHIQADDDSQVSVLLQLFTDWLVRHIAQSDRQIADYLKQKRLEAEQQETVMDEAEPQEETWESAQRQESKRQTKG